MTRQSRWAGESASQGETIEESQGDTQDTREEKDKSKSDQIEQNRQQSENVDSLLSQQEEWRVQAEVKKKIRQTPARVAESVIDDEEDIVINDDISKLWKKIRK